MDSVSKLKTRNYIISYSFISAFIILLGSAYFYLKNHFYLSEQELTVWQKLSNLNIEDGGYNYFLSHGPFAFNNLIGIVIKFIPDPSFILPHLIALCFFILAINIQLDKASERHDPIIKPLILFLLFCLTPSSLLVLLNRPIEIVLAVAIWTLNRGVMEANSKSLGRGIFVTSTACTFIILMGPSGVSYLMAFISLLPLFLKQKFFKDSPLNGYLVIFFPPLMAFLSLMYLAWLYNRSIVDLLFYFSKSVPTNFMTFEWLPFFLFLFVERDFKKTIIAYRTLFISLLAGFFYFTISPGFEIHPFIGFITLSLSLEVFDKHKIYGRHMLIVGLFFIVSWISIWPTTFNKIVDSFENNRAFHEETWPEINNRLQDHSLKTLVIGQNYSQYFIGIKRVDNIITPDLHVFKNYQKYRNFKDIDRIIVEQSQWQQLHMLSALQNRVYFSPPDGFRLAYDSEIWRIYLKESKRETPPIVLEKHGTLFDYLAPPLSPWGDALCALVFITMILLGRVYFYDRKQ